MPARSPNLAVSAASYPPASCLRPLAGSKRTSCSLSYVVVGGVYVQVKALLNKVFWDKGLRFVFTTRSKTPAILDDKA